MKMYSIKVIREERMYIHAESEKDAAAKIAYAMRLDKTAKTFGTPVVVNELELNSMLAFQGLRSVPQ